MTRLALLALPLALVAAKDDPLAGRVAGAPVDCIDLSIAGGPEIVDGRTILYRFTNRTIWRTEPVDRCPGLEPIATLIVEVHGSQLCRNDRFRTRRPGDLIPGPYCRFGRFTPYTRPPKGRSG